MKSLQQTLSESLVNERGNNPISKEILNQAIAGAKDSKGNVGFYRNILDIDQDTKEIGNKTNIKDEGIIQKALEYVRAAIECMGGSRSNSSNINGWIEKYFPGAFEEYLRDETNTDEKTILGIDFKKLGDTIAGLFR